jgi:integrase/recombinase XerD
MHTQGAMRTSSPTQNSWSEPRIGLGLKIMQDQMGHDHASTTSLYTCVSSDYRVSTLRRVLDSTVTNALSLGEES